ncbi:MAG TPA: 50S ribosomal protein L4 [bacterium]|nr:50S ribosomal protein L4 [bacterium]HPL95879.1 50S ribosomal protein L4 [bacterium]
MATDSLKTQVYSQTGEKIKQLELNPAIFGIKTKESVLHQVVIAQMANSRKRIAHTKLKSEVRGGGKKPWRQKGTGRARHGSTRSPLWVGGGVVFGPRNTVNFKQKVNQKMKTKALLMSLTDKYQSQCLTLLDQLSLTQGKTKEIVTVINNLKEILALKKISTRHASPKTNDEKNENQKFDLKKYRLSLLIVLPSSDKNIFRASKNINGLKITTANSLNTLDILKYKNLILIENSLPVIEKNFLKVK